MAPCLCSSTTGNFSLQSLIRGLPGQVKQNPVLAGELQWDQFSYQLQTCFPLAWHPHHFSHWLNSLATTDLNSLATTEAANLQLCIHIYLLWLWLLLTILAQSLAKPPVSFQLNVRVGRQDWGVHLVLQVMRTPPSLAHVLICSLPSVQGKRWLHWPSFA